MAKRDDFERWNEQMFKKHGNENRYTHPNFLIRYNSQKRIRQIISLIDAKRKEDVLELGCGSGYVLKQIKSYGSLTGVDLSDTALKEARHSLKGKKNVRLLKGDCQSAMLKRKFDKIICAEVLEHVPRPKDVIAVIIRHSKPGSTIVLTVPNEDLINLIYRIFSLLRLNKVFGGITIKMDWHLHEFNLRKLKKLLKGKLEITKTKKNPFWFFPLSYVVRCRVPGKK